MSTDGEAVDDSVALPREVHFYRYVDELGLVDTAAVGTSKATSEARGRGWQCGRRCARIVEEARWSLRGRRLFTLFAVVNLVNYLDRGVIPGGSEEFNAFIRQNLHTQRPDVFLGILQSAFILGFSVACLVFARLARSRSPFALMGVGLGVWCASSVLAGLSRPLSSYAFLLLARLLSGVGEASFVTVVPPLITETAPPGERGMWLALFYTAQPFGAGLGYVFGSAIATSRLGWQWAFYLEAVMMAPLALACSLVPKDRATTAANAADYGASSGSGSALRVHAGNNGRGTLSSTSNGCIASETYGNNDKVSPPLPIDQEASGARQRLAVSTSFGQELGGARRRHVDKGIAGARVLRDDDAEGLTGGTEAPRNRGGLNPAEIRQGTTTTADSSDEGLADQGREGGGRGNRWQEATAMTRRSHSWALYSGPEGDDQGRGEAEQDMEPLLDWQKHAAEWDSGNGFAASPSGGVSRGMERLEGGREEEDRGNHHRQTAILSASTNNGAVFLEPPGVGETQAGLPQEGVMVDDVLSVLDRSVFCLVVLGAAATAAVTAGMSTFGTGFVTSLELLSSETAAAATFGGVICAAGLTGTPAGGALIDAADPEGRMGNEQKLVVVLTQATVLMCCATVLVIAAAAQSSLIPFLVFFFLGGSLLFATTAHANLAVMLSAPKHLRPLSIAVNSIALHALGDVPSPTIVGALKDALAPHCAETGGVGAKPFLSSIASAIGGAVRVAMGAVVLSEDGGGGGAEGRGGGGWEVTGGGDVGEISDACRGERRGLHLTLFFVSSWLLWTCLFFSLARAVQQAALEQGMAPVSWGQIGCLISKGLFRPAWTRRAADRPCHLSRSSKPWFWRWRWGRRPASSSSQDFSADDVGSSLEQALLEASPRSSSDGSFQE